jgi:hypothetical protein
MESLPYSAGNAANAWFAEHDPEDLAFEYLLQQSKYHGMQRSKG